jgi:hypothetical protein
MRGDPMALLRVLLALVLPTLAAATGCLRSGAVPRKAATNVRRTLTPSARLLRRYPAVRL